MKRILPRPYWNFVNGAAMVTLLVLLATMQYRWTGEVSRAERERMTSALQETLKYFSAVFDQEFSRLFFSFGNVALTYVDLPDWEKEYADRFSQAYEIWQQAAINPRLLKDVLVAEIDADQEARLYRFNSASGDFVAQSWPEELTALRNAFQKQYRREIIDESASSWPFRQGIFCYPYYLLEKNSTFILPLVADASSQYNSQSLERHSHYIPVRRCLLVRFDADYLRSEFIPDLRRRFLSPDSVQQYDILIRSRNTTQDLIYCSSPILTPKDFSVPDGEVHLLQLRPIRMKTRADKQNPISINESRIPPLPAGSQGSAEQRHVAHSLESLRSPSSSVDTQREQDEREKIRQERMLESLLEGNEFNTWDLLVKHSSGSIDAVVTQARMKNLALSIGVLAMLTVSLFIFWISSRRAARLARQQMEFVAGVSHELRTPISVVCAAAENLKDGVVDNRDKIVHYGEFILREGRRLGELVEQTLAYAGISSERKQYQMQRADLGGIVRQAIHACASVAGSEGPAINARIDAELPAIRGDAVALRCALQNLIGNAIKYSLEKHPVEVLAQRSGSENQIEVAIRDKGIGIEPAELARIFDPFFRGSNAINRQIRGTGLGLSLVKAILEAHDGQIKVESTVGQGSTFTIILPVFVSDTGISNTMKGGI